MNRLRAFTLLELLSIVAIIAVLAAIAVPNFLEAQTRSKTSRTVADMAVVNAALRAYCADHGRYPPNSPATRDFLTACLAVEDVNEQTLPTPTTSTVSWNKDDPKFSRRDNNLPLGRDNFASLYPILDTTSIDLCVLTTPVAYFTRSVPVDVFFRPQTHGFIYINSMDVITTAAAANSEESIPRYILASRGPGRGNDHYNPIRGPYISYDPTNGTVSSGWILQFGDGRRSFSLMPKQ